MSKILTKPYKRWESGAELTCDQDEFLELLEKRPPDPVNRLVYVNAERMAQLEREGYFS